MAKRYFISAFIKAFRLVYEGEGEGGSGEGGSGEGGSGEGGSGEGGSGDAAAAATAATAAAAAAAATAATEGGEATDPELRKLKFSRDQQMFFNKRMQEERKKMKEQNEKVIVDLRKLQNQQGTTERQKSELQARIEELQQQYMTKEQLAQKEREKREKEHRSEIDRLKSEGESWRSLYTSSTITRAITDASSKADAFNADQIVAILLPNTRLVEETDGEGKPVGSFIPRVKLSDIDAEGKTVTLDMTVPEAVKRMKETPDRFGNLFKSGVAGGLGQQGSQNGSRGKKVNPADMTTAQWMKYRKEHPDLDVQAQ